MTRLPCQRCGGLVVPTRLFGPSSDHRGFESSRAWRCVNCGDVFDLLILRHRGFMARGVSNWLQPERACAAVVRGPLSTWRLPLFPHGPVKPT